jgi:Tfp pilus assembly protein FimT
MTSSTGPGKRPCGVLPVALRPAAGRAMKGAQHAKSRRLALRDDLRAELPAEGADAFCGVSALGRSRARRGGFTVVEILLVVLILGTLAGLAAPQLRGSYERMRLAECAGSLKNAIRMARELAITEGTPHRVVIDKTDGRYWVERQSEGGGRYESARDKWGSVRRIPEGIRIVSAPAAVSFRQDGRAIELDLSGAGEASDEYRSGGRSDQEHLRISLVNEMGDAASVVLETITGRVWVEAQRT